MQHVYTMRRASKIVPPRRVTLKDISLSFFPGAGIGFLLQAITQRAQPANVSSDLADCSEIADARTLSIRCLSMSTISNRQPCQSTVSPTDGTRPRSSIIIPDRVL